MLYSENIFIYAFCVLMLVVVVMVVVVILLKICLEKLPHPKVSPKEFCLKKIGKEMFRLKKCHQKHIGSNWWLEQLYLKLL